MTWGPVDVWQRVKVQDLFLHIYRGKKNPVMMCLNSSRVLILYLNKESNDKKQKVE